MLHIKMDGNDTQLYAYCYFILFYFIFVTQGEDVLSKLWTDPYSQGAGWDSCHMEGCGGVSLLSQHVYARWKWYCLLPCIPWLVIMTWTDDWHASWFLHLKQEPTAFSCVALLGPRRPVMPFSKEREHSPCCSWGICGILAGGVGADALSFLLISGALLDLLTFMMWIVFGGICLFQGIQKTTTETVVSERMWNIPLLSTYYSPYNCVWTALTFISGWLMLYCT